MAAAFLLAGRRFLHAYEFPVPSARSILEATGAGKTRAYELANRLLALLPTLERPVGRPPAARPEPPAPCATGALGQEVIRFLMAHPGSARGEKRRRYTRTFRHFVLDLRERFADVDLAAFADAVCVPLGTLEDWLRGDRALVAGDTETTKPPAPTPATNPRIQTILREWEAWGREDFLPFCRHLKENLRIPYGPTFISSVLRLYGVRIPRRRTRRTPDELALRKSFTTFFPGAQWMGDGMQVGIAVNDERFTFNFELDVDAATDAFVGACVSDEEDSNAVVAAYQDGVETTGDRPLALLLDNRFSNHTAEVAAALAENTIKIRATRGRGQSKPHGEGAFGLFEQAAPPLEIRARTAKDVAEQTLGLVVKTWARTLNHKPRKDRGGRSRIEIYRDPNEQPTDEQVEAARSLLDERRRKQEKAYETRRARENPIARALLDREFDRLALDDPNGNVRRAIARYPLDAILPGTALFEAKRNAHTLPDLDPAIAPRYLLGIVRNLSARIEDRYYTEALIRLRLDARDLALAPLDSLRRELLRDHPDPRDRLAQFLDRSLTSEPLLDRLFWLRAAADVLAEQSDDEQLALLRFAALRIRTTFAAKHEERQYAIHVLAQSCPQLQL